MARLAILRYHAKNKPLDGDGTALLMKVAEVTQVRGYNGSQGRGRIVLGQRSTYVW